MEGGIIPLSRNVIVKSKHLNAKVVQIGQEERGESPWRYPIMDMLNEEKGCFKFGPFFFFERRDIVRRPISSIGTWGEKSIHAGNLTGVYRSECLD